MLKLIFSIPLLTYWHTYAIVNFLFLVHPALVWVTDAGFSYFQLVVGGFKSVVSLMLAAERACVINC